MSAAVGGDPRGRGRRVSLRLASEIMTDALADADDVLVYTPK